VEPGLNTETKTGPDAHGDTETLIALARRGDREALGALFELYAIKVRRLLASIVGPGAPLDDLTQDVFIQVYRSLPKFRGDARLTTWLHRITAHVALSHLRKKKGRFIPTDPEVLGQYPDQHRIDAHSELLVREMMRHLYAVLDTLTPKRRIAFVLFAIEERSIAEVAEITGASPSVIKSRIWFARRDVIKKAGRDPILSPLLKELKR
jgi:RNA polymerase sigma-70 factor (ECF subfamily)